MMISLVGETKTVMNQRAAPYPGNTSGLLTNNEIQLFLNNQNETSLSPNLEANIDNLDPYFEISITNLKNDEIDQKCRHFMLEYS